MHLRFLTLPTAERQLYFEQVAARRSLHVAIVEKDFWVCWLLGALFADPNLRDVVVFKGGTSLSKVHRAITRFSEDIDLSVAPAWLGIAEDELGPEASRGQRDRWMIALQQACTRKVVEELRPRLEATISAALGPPQNSPSWLEYQNDTATNSPVLLMH